MAKKKRMKIGELDYLRIFNWEGGMNDAVNAALLNDNESPLLENVSLDQKGTLSARKGSSERYSPDIGSSPIAGMGDYYKSDGTTRLLIATEDGKLYVDTPHLVNEYDTTSDFNEGMYQATVFDGSKLWAMLFSTGFEEGNFAYFQTHDNGWAIDKEVYNEGTKSAKGTGANQKLIREVFFNADTVYIKAVCRFAETDKAHYPVILISPADTEIQAVVADTDGNLKYHNGTSLAAFPTPKSYTADTWCTIEVFIRGGTFWVSIDGESLTADGITMKDTANSAQSQVSKAMVKNAGDTEATMWVDKFVLNALPAIFSRASTAEKLDTTVVGVNKPRYEKILF